MTDSVDIALPTRAPRAPIVAWLERVPALQVMTLLALIVWAAIRIPAITTPVAVKSVLVIAALLGLAAMGQTLVVILGGLDLAVPGYITVGAYAAAVLAGAQGWPLPVAVLTVVAVCGLVGAFTGYVCHRFSIQPLVVTLGTGAMLVGGTLFVSNGDFTSAPPDAVRALAGITATTFGIPIPPVLVIWVVAGVAMWFLLTRTPLGRRIYATGADPRAARLTRVRTSAIWTGVFAASGVLAGLTGVLIAGFAAGSSSAIGEPYLFTGLAAVLVGGTTFGSVRGDYTRTALGALILTLLSTILVGEGFDEGRSRVLYGLIILGVVLLYGREKRVRDRF